MQLKKKKSTDFVKASTSARLASLLVLRSSSSHLHHLPTCYSTCNCELTIPILCYTEADPRAEGALQLTHRLLEMLTDRDTRGTGRSVQARGKQNPKVLSSAQRGAGLGYTQGYCTPPPHPAAPTTAQKAGRQISVHLPGFLLREKSIALNCRVTFILPCAQPAPRAVTPALASQAWAAPATASGKEQPSSPQPLRQQGGLKVASCRAGLICSCN